MRINKTYSKLSVGMMAAAILAAILSAFELTGFEYQFLIIGFLFFVILSEVISVFNERIILKGIVNVMILFVTGYGFFFLMIIGSIVFFGAAGGKANDVTLSYILLMLCDIALFCGAGARFLNLFNNRI